MFWFLLKVGLHVTFLLLSYPDWRNEVRRSNLDLPEFPYIVKAIYCFGLLQKWKIKALSHATYFPLFTLILLSMSFAVSFHMWNFKVWWFSEQDTITCFIVYLSYATYFPLYLNIIIYVFCCVFPSVKLQVWWFSDTIICLILYLSRSVTSMRVSFQFRLLFQLLFHIGILFYFCMFHYLAIMTGGWIWRKTILIVYDLSIFCSSLKPSSGGLQQGKLQLD